MNAHSTAVAIIDIELDLDNDTDIDVTTENGEDVDSQVGQRDKVREKLRRLQADHVWIREELMHLQRRMVAQRLARQRRAYQSMEQMQQLLCRLQETRGLWCQPLKAGGLMCRVAQEARNAKLHVSE